MNLDQQKNSLRSMGSLRLLNWTQRSFFLLTLAFVVAGVAKGMPWLFLFAFFLLLCALFVHQATPHVLNATKGLKHGRRTVNAVMVEDLKNSFDKKIQTLEGDPYCWNFIAHARGWNPRPGLCQAHLYWIDEVEWPVLVVLDHGILYPREIPRRIEE